ncbi:Solute carrier family 12 member 2 [Trichoplax sp. H2]|nr:Solute carrier family 12 member 2 [Trichoplax sp. H2]|eukprot:RDD45716.1 Solute carrier family 12 member 2 [Trichoplax sp. H2]
MPTKLSNLKNTDDKSKASKFRVRVVNSNPEANDNLPVTNQNIDVCQVKMDYAPDTRQEEACTSDLHSCIKYRQVDEEKGMMESYQSKRGLNTVSHNSGPPCHSSKLDSRKSRNDNLEVAFDLSSCGHGSKISNSKNDYRTNYSESAHHIDTYSPYYTTEALPMLTFYKQATTPNSNYGSRPTLDDLHCPDKTPARETETVATQKLKTNGVDDASKFGWIKGVLIRCLLNIWGVMLFSRLSWVVGQAGLAAVITVVTTLSMSAICSNGEVKGGGAYYLISRSLGPEFGGAIGLIFSTANAIGVALYIVGFAEAVRDYLKVINVVIVDDLNDIRIIGVIAATLIFVIVMIGVAWEARAQLILFVLLVGAIINCIVGPIIYSFTMPEEKRLRGFTGLNGTTFLANMPSKFSPGESFFTIFAVFFPAATGILAGANVSAILKNPSKSIPKGTLSAILISTITYLGLACLFASSVVRSTAYASDGINVVNCTFPNSYGLLCDYQVASMISAWEPLTAAGIFAATISSALASLVGAPNVLQSHDKAVGKDKLFPYVKIFGVGYGKMQEPRRGYALTYAISMAFIAIGDLNDIAPIISNFFLIAYALINYSCFDASQACSPGWRPSFKYYSKWCSLLGAVLCIGAMFVINWWAALITIGFVASLYKYVDYTKPEVNWGSSVQARQYVSALNAAYRLNATLDHVKNFRPQCLVLCGNISERRNLVQFASHFTTNTGLLICGIIQPEKARERLQEQYEILQQMKIRAFISSVTSNDLLSGARSLMQACGLGKLSPNMILFGYMENWKNRLTLVDDYVNIIHDAFDLNFGVAIFRNKNNISMVPNKAENSTRNTNESKNGLDEILTEMVKLSPDDNFTQLKDKPKRKNVIDIWWIYDDGGLTVLIPYLLSLSRYWSNCKLRVLTPGKPERLQLTMIRMATLLKKFRIDYENVIALGDINEEPCEESISLFRELSADCEYCDNNLELDDKSKRHIKIGELLLKHSAGSNLVVITLPIPRKNVCTATKYMSWLEVISGSLTCPVLMIRGNQTNVLTFNS